MELPRKIVHGKEFLSSNALFVMIKKKEEDLLLIN